MIEFGDPVDVIPAVSGLIGALIGGYLSYKGTLVGIDRQEQKERERFKTALISEIESYQLGFLDLVVKHTAPGDTSSDVFKDTGEKTADEINELLVDHSDKESVEELIEEFDAHDYFDSEWEKYEVTKGILRLVAQVNLTSPVYTGNIGKIGLLEDDEIRSVISFYDELERMHRILDDVIEEEQPVDESGEFDAEKWKKNFRRHFYHIDYYLDLLQQKRETALAELKDD